MPLAELSDHDALLLRQALHRRFLDACADYTRARAWRQPCLLFLLAMAASKYDLERIDAALAQRQPVGVDDEEGR